MRVIKVFLGFIFCIGLIGGCAYFIYDAVVNQDSVITLSINGKSTDVSSLVQDYSKIADGETIQLPISDEELKACGVEIKYGYTFDYWSYDVKGNKIVEAGLVVKNQGVQTIYLNFKKLSYKVYLIDIANLDDDKKFDYTGFGDVSRYSSLANISDSNILSAQLINFEETINLGSKSSDEEGYEYTWVKWTGEGSYEQEENGTPKYFSGRQTITEDTVFVQRRLPKKYNVSYVYTNEDNQEVELIRDSLTFDSSLLYKSNSSTFSRERVGYDFTGYYLDSTYNQSISNIQILDKTILDVVGDSGSFKIYLKYTPKNYNVYIIGYSNDNVILKNGVTETFDNSWSSSEKEEYWAKNCEIYLKDEWAYYSSLQSLLNSIDKNQIKKDWLDWKSYSKEDGTSVNESDKMPANSIVIRANYDIKEYNVNIILQLKDETVQLSSDTKTFRHGSSFTTSDMITIDDAKDSKKNTVHYNVDEYDFEKYVLTTSKEPDNVIYDSSLDENSSPEESAEKRLTEQDSLKNLTCNMNITIVTNKIRFFIEFNNYSYDSSTVVEQVNRVELNLDNQYVSYIDKEGNSISIDSLKPAKAYPNKGATENSYYKFGGWKLSDVATYGDYAYLFEYGYKIESSTIKDDIEAVAVWYYDALLNFSFKKLEDTITIGDKTYGTARVTNYNGRSPKLAIPTTITIDGTTCYITEIGNDPYDENGNKILTDDECPIFQSITQVQSIFVSKYIQKIYSYAFGNKFVSDNLLVRFEENGTYGLTLEDYAFANVSSSSSSSGSGVASVCLPKRLDNVGSGIFRDNRNISYLYVTEDTTDYSNKYKDVVYSETVDDKTLKGIVLYAGSYNDEKEFVPNKIVAYCTKNSLQKYCVPDTITEISSYAFYMAKGLTSITAEESNNIEKIGDYAFSYILPLETVKFTKLSKLVDLGEGIFSNSFYNEQSQSELKKMPFKYVSFDFNGLESVPDYMFNSCKNLIGVEFINAENISIIGKSAFKDVGSSDTYKGSEYYSYENIKSGFANFMQNRYNKIILSSGNYSENINIQAYLREYLQSFYQFQTLTSVDDNAFQNSIFSIYAETSIPFASSSGSASVVTIGLSAFEKCNFYPLSSSSSRYSTWYEGKGKENKNYLELSNCDISGSAFKDVVFNNINLQILNSVLSQYSLSNVTKNGGDFSIDVKINLNDESERSIKLKAQNFYNVFCNITASKITLSCLGNNLSMRVFSSITCDSVTIENISNFVSTLFGSSNDNSGCKIKELKFNNCKELEITSESSKRLVFKGVANLETLDFYNCDALYNAYNENKNEFLENILEFSLNDYEIKSSTSDGYHLTITKVEKS